MSVVLGRKDIGLLFLQSQQVGLMRILAIVHSPLSASQRIHLSCHGPDWKKLVLVRADCPIEDFSYTAKVNPTAAAAVSAPAKT